MPIILPNYSEEEYQLEVDDVYCDIAVPVLLQIYF